MAAFDSTATPAHAAGPERTGLDSEWCAERASDALRWLAVNYPECSGSEALHPHQDAAHAAAVAGGEAMKRFKAFVFGKGAA